MANIKVRYLTKRKRKDGSARYFWQPDENLKAHGWKLTRLSDDIDIAIKEAQDINQRVDKWRAGIIKNPSTQKSGTIDHLIETFQSHRDYKDKRERTRKDYDSYLRIISEWAGDMPARTINARMVQDLYDKIRDKKPRKASYLITVLRLLFSFAERQSLIPIGTNPATNPKITYKAKKAMLWTPDMVKDFVEEADKDPSTFAIGTAVVLNEWLGQRPGDVLRIGMDMYRNGSFEIEQSKTGAIVVLDADIVPHLKRRIEEQYRRNQAQRVVGHTLIQRTDGLAYSVDWFGRIFGRIRAAAAEKNPKLKDAIFKDLRHTAVTRLAESGAEIPEIAAVTGHTFKSCQEIIDRYNVRTTKMARGAFLKRIQAEEK